MRDGEYIGMRLTCTWQRMVWSSLWKVLRQRPYRGSTVWAGIQSAFMQEHYQRGKDQLVAQHVEKRLLDVVDRNTRCGDK